ncbi:AAEL009993-PA [Aedes aegypti]|uniref:AAEL009993-PA n=1 Tax=Aedes aegypti TaxID=7159 RepID=Q16U82_AEDAE|nr:AAEL009993-PA [Aedes aegypti]8FJP_A Chain A, salivary gland surface protein 1 [Aedes aegypti]
MLRIKEVKKYNNRLGFPAGKEVRIRPLLEAGGFARGPIYVKYGRELSKHDPSSRSMAWNATVFDTALNHPTRPWTVTVVGGKKMVLGVRKEGLGFSEDDPPRSLNVKGGDDMADENYGGGNSTIVLVKSGGKDFAIGLDDLKELNSFGIGAGNGKLSLALGNPVNVLTGVVLPVEQRDGSVAYVAVNSDTKSVIYKVDAKGLQKNQKIDVNVRASAEKILLTKNNELLHISPQGLNVYSVQGSASTFKYFCPYFSSFGGWSRRFVDTVTLMDEGGNQEALIGTGPKGIEYMPVDEKCKNYVVEGVQDAKHAVVAPGATKEGNDIKVLGVYNGELCLLTLEVVDAVEPKLDQGSPAKPSAERVKATKSSKVTVRSGALSKPVSWLRDSLDEASFKNIVDKLSGKIRFSFPLVDLQGRMGLPIKLVVYYDESDGEDMSVLGRHWTLGRDCIVLDHGNTVFEDKQDYYLVKDQMKIRLERDWTKPSANGKVLFNMVGNKDATFEYTAREEKWEVSDGKIRYVYGMNNQGVVSVPGWADWYGPSANYDSKKIHSVQWNLVEISSVAHRDVKLKYTYTPLDPSTHTMHLLSITDDSNKTTIKFSYKTIEGLGKQVSSGLVKEHKFINNKLLEKVEIDSPSTAQVLKLTSTKIDSLYYLESIKQDDDPDPVLGFEYNKDDKLKPRVQQIRLPSKSVVDFKYTKQAIATQQFEQEIAKMADLYTGNEYSLEIEKTVGETDLYVRLKDSAGKNDFIKNQSIRIESYRGFKIKSYSPFMMHSYIAILVRYAEEKEKLHNKIYILNKGEDDSWKLDTTNNNSRVSEDKKFKYDFQEDSFVYYHSKKVHFEYKKSGTKVWSYTSKDIGDVDAFTLMNRGAVYCKNDLVLIRWDALGKLQQETLSDAKSKPSISDVDTFFEYIDVQGTFPEDEAEAKKEVDDYKRDLKESLSDYGLILYNNVVALRTIKLSFTGRITVKVLLYLLKHDYTVSSRSSIELQGGDLAKFNLTLDVFDEHKTKNTNDLDKYRFEFKKQGSKFKLTYIEATDKDNKPTKPSSQNEKLIGQYERRMKIPLDFEKYMMQVNQEGIIVNDHQIIHDNGNFIAKQLDRDTLKLTKFKIPLGAFSNFKKDSDGDEIKLCTKTEQERTESCVSLQTNSARNVSIKYPYYLVTQKKNDIKVLPLKINSRGWEDSVDYRGEILHGSSSHAAMVTTRMSDQKTIVRPLKALNKINKIYAQVISEEKLTTPYDSYVIKYEYEDPVVSMNQVAFKTTIVVPGGGKSATGYYRETNDLQDNQQIVQVMTADNQVFDPEYVKRMNEMQQEEDKQRDGAQLDAEQTITDKSGYHPILKTTPYSANQELVQFLGFEDYEDMTGWTVNKRPIQESNIRRNEFSATGRNFLLLKKGEELIAEFPNTAYYDNFIASTWIRTAQEATVGSTTDMLLLYVDNKPMKGTIKQSIDEWIYVEADSREIVVSESTTVKRVLFKIIVKSTGADDVHVDHVRLSPVNFNFEGSVYDARIGQRTATIQTNGFVSRRLYDAYNRRIAEVDETGNIKYLASYSKRVGNTKDEKKREGGYSSRIQMRAKHSWVESFSPYTMEKRWQIGGTATVEPNQAILQGQIISKEKFSSESICIRLVYSMSGSSQLSLTIGKTTVVVKPNAVQYKGHTATTPSNAELVIFATPKLTSIWVDGHLRIEAPETHAKFNNEAVSLQTSGPVGIKDVIVMEDAEIQVSYLNRDSKPLQEILLLDSSNVLIRQMMYDVIGRRVAETVWVQKSLIDGRSTAFKAFQYHDDFVSNDNPTDRNYFLNTGPMQGYVATATNTIYEGYPYSQTVYYNNPLEIRHKVGHPGVKNSIKGAFVHQYAIASDLAFIQRNYPKNEGYRQEEEKSPNGKKHVVVYNRRNKKVAEYTQVKDYNNILTTYIYDQHGNQIQMLPPSYYHEKSRSGDYQPEKQVVASPWAVTSKYDSTGEFITSKETPDGGRVEFIYNEYNQLRYQIHYKEDKQADKIVYFLYNIFGRMCEAGQVPANPTTLQQVRETTKSHQAIPNRDQAVYFDYGETESEPSLRGRIQRTVKKNKEVLFSEVMFFDEESNIIRKSYISPTTNETLSLVYLQENDKVSGIQYPFGVDGKQLILKYKHNLRGEIVEVARVEQKTSGQTEFIPIAGIDHDAEGKVTKISHNYGDSKFDQTYKYVAPGYLVEIANNFLTEKLYYTEKGYGCEPTGDGSILRTEFKASWHDKCDQNLIPLTARAFVSGGIDFTTAETCFDALLNLGYIDTTGRPVKTFYPDLETGLPMKCATPSNWRYISEKMLEQGYPEHYGHAYDYGSHGELIAAKSFVGKEKDSLTAPLSKASFANAGMKSHELDRFWDSLSRSINKVEGTKAIFEGTQQLTTGLVGSVIHKPKLESLLEGKGGDSSICTPWSSGDRTEEAKCKREYQQAFDKLKLKQVIQSLQEPVRKNVLRILKNTLASMLGNSPGDVESFSIDPNGNHGVFYTGFKRFELKYKHQKNQIATIKEGTKQQEKMIVHDDEGNVIKALHKKIDKIEYDPLTQRVSRIEMSDRSRTLEFGYDFRGERTFKRVRNKDNDIISVNYYVRDNKGNVLVEYKQEYPNPKDTNKPINTVTAYIHGPLGLLGFFRNNKYYNVLLDHEGSTRLVIHQGKVVAAYDYLPYGQMIRKYGSNPEAHIAFRYTGQEFDEETGLYNYHARLYDPDIGRFFQMDPMEQYASPYKYAGNSPVSQIDPDGQIAVTLVLMIIGAIVGAYLGAASANNSWNPAKWAWGDKKTWIGLFAGAIMGAFAVYGGAATFSYFTAMFGGSMIAGALATGVISVAGAFLGAAAASNQWNPAKWDWTSPAVWNGLLSGASIAVSFPSGFVGITRSFMSISSNLVKMIYASLMVGGFLLFVYLGGGMANNFNFQISQWDWKSPRTWFGMIEGASTIFMGTAGTAKHGAAKVYNVVKPNGLKMIWHKVNIPSKAFTMRRVKDTIILTWYKNGQSISKQILKTTVKADLAKIPKDFIMIHRGFFMPYQRIGYAAIAMPSMAGLMFKKNQYFFTNHPNGTLTKHVRKKRSAPMSSSAASPSVSNFLNDFFENMSELFDSFFSQTEHSHQDSQSSLSIGASYGRPSNESYHKSFQKLCYSPDSDGNQIICPQRESTVNIFSKGETFAPEAFGQDLFSRCLPLTWHDRPSIACDGEQTTFIYTPNQNIRVFDMVDGWLMLARIAPAALRNLKAGFSFLRDVVFSDEREQTVQVNDLSRCKQDLEVELLDLKRVMLKKQPNEVKWAQPILNDLEDDIGEFLSERKPSEKEFELLQERLSALREEIMENSSVATELNLSTLIGDMLKKMDGVNVGLNGDVRDMISTLSGMVPFSSSNLLA